MVNHAEEMAKPGITPGGYVKACTFQHIRKHLELVANDDTDNGLFVLEDGTLLTARFIDLAEDLDYKLVLRVGEEPPVENLLTKSVAADALNFFVRTVLDDIDALLAGEPVEESDPKPASTASEPSSSAAADTGATDEEGKSAPVLGTSPLSDTPTESAPVSEETVEDTTASGDSTNPPAPVDPAETASEPEPAEAATASSETATNKSRKKKDAE